MGTRVIRKRGESPALKRKEARALAAIIAAIVLPLFLAYILVAFDMRTDLSDLKPIRPLADPTTLLPGWDELEVTPGHSELHEEPRWLIRPQVRMPGYMMENDQPSPEHEQTDRFVLSPEAGHLLHPAHRIADQMVEIRLIHAAPFSFRRLVWVSGVLAQAPERTAFEKPRYVMRNAEIAVAADADITRWFRP